MISNLNILDIVGKNTSAIKAYKGDQLIWEKETREIGLQVDFDAGTYTRLGAAVGLNAGTDFDLFSMYGGRRRCNVSDDGTIVAYFGDLNYREDGSNGQVMVYQPKFYYKVEPLLTEQQTTSPHGYYLHKANYYVTDKPTLGFKLHPAFYDKNGDEIDYVLRGAFEASIYDTSAGAYLTNNEQVMDIAVDKLSSIGGVVPAGGGSQALTKENIERLAINRGLGWHSDLVKIVSMDQLLCMIEMGTMDFQSAIGKGVTDYTIYSTSSTMTGSTIGNRTQEAEVSYCNGSPQTASGKKSVSYRGVENSWGNMYTSVYGINIWGDRQMNGGQPYICTDFSFAENKHDGNYVGAGFTLPNNRGYIQLLGYSDTCDWLFMPTRYYVSIGDSIVKDKVFVTSGLNDYRNAYSGGYYGRGSDAGGFCWSLDTASGNYVRNFGGRLTYVPTKNNI